MEQQIREENGKPVVMLDGFDTYREAADVADTLREGRTREERRSGMDYRVVARPNDPRSFVERFYNW